MRQGWLKLIASIGVSVLILWLLFRFISDEANPLTVEDLMRVLGGIPASTFLAFLAIHLVGMVFRTFRFQILIAATGSEVKPSFWPLWLITLVRSMTVDMLPARLGELFYVGLLNRGLGVRLEHCFSSLAISIWFDLMVIIPLILGLLLYPALEAGMQQRLLVISVMLIAICAIGIFILHPGMSIVARWIGRFPESNSRLIGWARRFVNEFADSIESSLTQGTIVKTFLLTVGVRFCKYSSISLLFVGIANSSFPSLTGADPVSILVALLASEAGASLPVPTFMSFGSYEAGGLAAFSMLGFPLADAGLALFSVHIATQSVDYTMGAVAFVLFLMITGMRPSMMKDLHKGGREGAQ